MDFSLFYFADDSGESATDRYGLLMEGARFADEHGFHAVWTPERHFDRFGGLYPNPAVTGAAVAAVTNRVRIRAGSVVSPLHHPLRLAEDWSVVDNLSDGRAGISLASGWHATDFCLNPAGYADRRATVFTHVEQLRSLWRGEPMAVTDGRGRDVEVRIFPPPVQPELPIWITSGGDPETFRGAGRVGAGLLTHLLGQDIDQLADKLAEYRRAAGAGRGHVVVMLHTFLGEDDEEIRSVVREPLMAYLRSSISLLLGSDLARKFDPARLRPQDIEFLVTRSFDRYFDNGLLGSVDKARGVLARLRDIGVDEVACLIDFGLPAKDVLAALTYLDRLRELTAGEDGRADDPA